MFKEFLGNGLMSEEIFGSNLRKGFIIVSRIKRFRQFHKKVINVWFLIETRGIGHLKLTFNLVKGKSLYKE